MKRYVIGDIHGAYKALIQVVKRAAFDYEIDQLICLGDVADGWPETKACIDELLKIKHLIFILGNHDKWAFDWMKTGWQEAIWIEQGGKATVQSYGLPWAGYGIKPDVPESHIRLFEQAYPYYVSDNHKLFVHGGYDPGIPIENQPLDTLLWDRSLFNTALSRWKIGDFSHKLTAYDEVFIGHTTTESFSEIPVKMADVWALDQGAGWGGKLTIMDVDTHEYWQSDRVRGLYQGTKGRY